MMMVEYGHGVDFVERRRFEEIFVRNIGLLEDVFTEQERQDCFGRKEPWKHLAGRFAVKEACLKALRLGLSGLGIDHTWREIEILTNPAGRAEIVTHGWIARRMQNKRATRWEIAIAFTRNYAIAAALVVSAVPERSDFRPN